MSSAERPPHGEDEQRGRTPPRTLPTTDGLWNKRASASNFQAMDAENRRRFVLYGISNPYFDSICDGRLRSVVLGSSLPESPDGGRHAERTPPPLTISRAKEMLDRIRPVEKRLRRLAKECLSAALEVDIIMMPGEDQLERDPPTTLGGDDYEPVSSGWGNPPEKYDALTLDDKRTLRFIAGNMNAFVIEINKTRDLLEQKNKKKTIERRVFEKKIEDLQIRFLALKNAWLFRSKDAICYGKRKLDAA